MREVSVTSSGRLRVHGLLNNRCPGSRQTPDQSCQPRDSESSPAYSESVPLSADAASGAPSDSSSQFSSAISLLGQRFQPLRRIPKGSREAAGAKLKAILEDVVASNTVEAWERLLLFPGVVSTNLPEEGKDGRWPLRLIDKLLMKNISLWAPTITK